MKKKPSEFDDTKLYREMKCMACESCYEVYDTANKVWTGSCVYGGPFTSYLISEDYDRDQIPKA